MFELTDLTGDGTISGNDIYIFWQFVVLPFFHGSYDQLQTILAAAINTLNGR